MSYPGKLADPGFCHKRAVLAGRASGQAARRKAMARVSDLAPLEAWATGYRTGYARAYRYWQAWAKRQQTQRAA